MKIDLNLGLFWIALAYLLVNATPERLIKIFGN